MSATTVYIAQKAAQTRKSVDWDLGLWLLILLPIVASVVFLVMALLNPDGQFRPDFGYDQWLPAEVHADERGR